MKRLLIKIKVKLKHLWLSRPETALASVWLHRFLGNKVIVFTKLHPIYSDFAYSNSIKGYRYVYLNPAWQNLPVGKRVMRLSHILHADAATVNDSMLNFKGPILIECEGAAKPEWFNDPRIKQVIFQSKYAAGRTRGLLDPLVIYPAVQVGKRKRLDKPKQKFRLLTVGYGCLIKGYDVSFEIFRRLKNKGYAVELIIAGKSEHNFGLYPEATYEAFEAGNYSNIEDYGVLFEDLKIKPFYREELWNSAYPESFVLLHFARMETFGFTILEAMSFGLPVISVNFKAIPEMVHHGDNGFLCNPFDWDGFSEIDERRMNNPRWASLCIEEGERYTEMLINNPALYKNMSDAAFQAAQQFGFVKRADALSNVID